MNRSELLPTTPETPITSHIYISYTLSTLSNYQISLIYSDLEIYSLFLFMLLLQVVGCFGNSLTILGLWKRDTNLIMLIKQISLVCFVECVWTISMNYVSVFHRRWVLPDMLIYFTGYIDNSLYMCCVWILALSAIERYLSLRHPLTYRNLCKRKYFFKVASLTCWAVSFIFCSYPLVKDEFDFDRLTFTVGLVADDSYFFPVYFCATFALPLLVIGFTYTEILRMSRTRIRMKKAIEQEHGLPMPSRKGDFRLAIMVMLTFLNLAGTHLPVIVFIICHFAGLEIMVTKRLSIGVNVILMAGFALQSYIFLATLTELQDMYKEIFCCFIGHRRRAKSSKNHFDIELSLTFSSKSKTWAKNGRNF